MSASARNACADEASVMVNELELESDIIFFTGHGFTWEYPGFFLMQFGDYEITVGYDNGPKKYCLQVNTNDGACCEGSDGDCDTRDEVLANVVRLTATKAVS